MILSLLSVLVLAALTNACPFAEMARRSGAKIDVAAIQKAHAQYRKREVKQDDVAGTFVLRSRVKTNGSPVFGQGFPVGYSVNGFETPVIEVTAGKTYAFQIMSGCNHPFYITSDPRGRRRAPIDPSGYNLPDPAKTGNEICNGKTIKWTPPKDLVGAELYYQCTVHDKMGWRVVVKPETFCNKYTEALRDVVLNNAGLVGAVVDRVFQNITNTLPAMETGTAPTGLLTDYFNGAIPSGSINYLEDSPAAAAAGAELATQLLAFFGQALGCTDGSIPPYNATRTMKEIHNPIPIGVFEYDAFNSAVIEAMRHFGVAQADLDIVLDVLNGVELKASICNIDADCQESICNKYSAKKKDSTDLVPGANKELLTLIVDEAFTRVLADDLLKPFFNGMTPSGSKNFFGKDAGETQGLKDRFIAFLGIPGVLTCTDPQFPVSPLTVADMKAIHANMPIDTAVFEKFNLHIIEAIKSFDLVSDADITAIENLLASLEPLLCNQPGCSTVADNSIVFDVTIAAKDTANPAHHFADKGFPAGFQIDGQFQEGLVLEAGKTYSFRAKQGCFHPFYISTGTGRSPDIEEGIKAGQVGQNFCDGKILEFTPTTNQVGQEMFFACRNHDFMGGRVCVVNPGESASCKANAANPPLNTLSPCDQLTLTVAAQGNPELSNSNQTITKVVVELFLFGAVNDPAPLAKYFNGVQPPGSLDYITNLENQGRLVHGLVKWFGTNLGCTDNSIDIYKPDEIQPNMKTAHQFMDIKKPEFDAFNAKLVELLKAVPDSATPPVGLGDEAASAVASFLGATSPDICSDCEDYEAPSFCEKWAQASTVFKNDQKAMLDAVVQAVFDALTTGEHAAIGKQFFDGTVPCDSRDFVSNRVQTLALKRSLVAFFGSAGALGCTQAGFPQYRGETDMELVHKFMPIGKEVYDAFVGSLAATVKGALEADVPSIEKDLEKVAELLYSPGIYATCNQPDCDVEGMTGGTYVEKCPPTEAPTEAPTTVDGTGNPTSTGGPANTTPAGGDEATTGQDVTAASSLSMAMASVLVLVIAMLA